MLWIHLQKMISKVQQSKDYPGLADKEWGNRVICQRRSSHCPDILTCALSTRPYLNFKYFNKKVEMTSENKDQRSKSTSTLWKSNPTPYFKVATYIYLISDIFKWNTINYLNIFLTVCFLSWHLLLKFTSSSVLSFRKKHNIPLG